MTTPKLDPDAVAVVDSAHQGRRLGASEAAAVAQSLRAVLDALPATNPTERRFQDRLRAASRVLDAKAYNARRRHDP